MRASPARREPLPRLLRWLARRDRSEREIRERLLAWGTEPDAITSLVAELAGRGLIDDQALAERICDWHCRRDPLGPRRLRARLETRGIAARIAEAAVAPLLDRDRQRELARRLIRKRLPALLGLSPERRTRRLGAYLARRGFDDGIVRELVMPLLREDASLEDFD